MSMAGADFTDVLIQRGIVGPDQIEEARQLAESTGISLQDAIVKLGYASADEVMQAIAQQLGIDYVDLSEIQIPGAIVQLIPESVARENIVMPVAQEDGRLKVAIADPMDYETVDKLRFILNREIEIALAPRDQILDAINRHYGQTETESVDSLLQEFTDTAIDFTETEALTPGASVMADDSDAPIVRLVNLIIEEAVRLRASDIHIEPFQDRVRIRYRIDGVCVERDAPPRRILGPLLSRIKIMASMDIAEKRRPQDGRIKTNVNGKDIDLRVSVLPSIHGQAVVMRILDKSNIMMGIRELGFMEDDYRRFLQIIKRPNGIFLVTGPTGSGKTTTLYAALNELNRPDRKIITAEDPVEYYLPGINQVEVKSHIGLTFARIIRAMLRQSPNIILVGEIRDKETADMAIQASLTGHLVFSTLHTNDAPSAITRLIDLGVQPFLVAASVMAVMAQRLVRKICTKCAEPDQPHPSELAAVGLTPEQVKKANFRRGRGCSQCHHTGYKGRIGIFELMQMNSTLREMTYRREPTQAIRRQARLFGMRTLLEDGVLKAMRGITTLEEVLAVAHHEAVNV